MSSASEKAALALRPSYKDKVSVNKIKEIIKETLQSQLTGLTYQSEHTSNWTKQIADEIRDKLKALNKQRYKFMVQVVIGEQRGEGVRMGCRCFWDQDTDNYAEDTYRNDSLFCVAAAFGAYLY